MSAGLGAGKLAASSPSRSDEPGLDAPVLRKAAESEGSGRNFSPVSSQAAVRRVPSEAPAAVRLRPGAARVETRTTPSVIKGPSPAGFARVLAETPLRPGAVTRLRIALAPGSLGELLIDLSQAGAGLHGRILADSEASRDRLSSGLEDLRRRLEEQGLRFASLEVVLDEAAEEAGPGSLRRQVLDVRA